MPPERLQKLLSRRGVASRRVAEAWIEAGRVKVNGVVVRELGVKVDPDGDRVEVDGRPLPAETPPVAVLLHKPAGFVTTVRDRHADRTVMELLTGLDRRVYPVGRLDKDTRGVLLLTDDGDLTQSLLHPSRGVEKVYEVTAVGPLDDAALATLAGGVVLEDGPTAPARLWGVERQGGRTRFRLALHQGRKRQVRRMVQAVGGRVVDLVRLSFGGLTLGGLPEGTWRFLTPAEVRILRRAARGEGSGAGPKAPRPQAATRRRAQAASDRETSDRGHDQRRIPNQPRATAPGHRRRR